jgi:hypothetical protein
VWIPKPDRQATASGDTEDQGSGSADGCGHRPGTDLRSGSGRRAVRVATRAQRP